MQAIKIFVEAHSFDDGFEGTSTYLYNLYTTLIGQYPNQYHIILGCCNSAKLSKIFSGFRNIQIVQYKTKNRYKRILWDIPILLKQLQPDYAHFQYFTPLVKQCRWIVTIHDLIYKDFSNYYPIGYKLARDILYPLSSRRSDILTTVSNYSKERILCLLPTGVNKIHIVPNGIDNYKDEPSTKVSADIESIVQKGDRYFICVSRFEPRKNQRFVLESFVEGGFYKQGIKMIFVGNRTHKTPDFDIYYESLGKEIRNHIILIENIDTSDLKVLYQKSIASIYPSLAEGFGLPPIEAASLRVPSLCSNNTAMQDFAFLAPFFFDPNIKSTLIEKMDYVVKNNTQMVSLLDDIGKRVETQYSWAASAETLDRVIKDDYAQSKFVTR